MKLLWFNFLLPWIWPTGFNGSIEAYLKSENKNHKRSSAFTHRSLGFLMPSLAVRFESFSGSGDLVFSVFNLDNFIKMIPWLCGYWGLQMNQPTYRLSLARWHQASFLWTPRKGLHKEWNSESRATPRQLKRWWETPSPAHLTGTNCHVWVPTASPNLALLHEGEEEIKSTV